MKIELHVCREENGKLQISSNDILKLWMAHSPPLAPLGPVVEAIGALERALDPLVRENP